MSEDDLSPDGLARDHLARDHLARNDLARRRFFTIQAVRIGGLALLLFGIVAVNGRIGVPREAGYVLVPVGLVLFAVLPVRLARRWKSP